MSFNELGDMCAEVVEAIWDSYLTRKALDQIDQDRRDQILALSSNGMLDQDGHQKQMQRIQEEHAHSRRSVLGTDHNVEEEEGYLGAHSPFIQAAKA